MKIEIEKKELKGREREMNERERMEKRKKVEKRVRLKGGREIKKEQPMKDAHLHGKPDEQVRSHLEECSQKNHIDSFSLVLQEEKMKREKVKERMITHLIKG